MHALLQRLIEDEAGQDLIEYGLLTFFIGLVGYAVWDSIQASLGAAYSGYDTNVQGLATPAPPGATP